MKSGGAEAMAAAKKASKAAKKKEKAASKPSSSSPKKSSSSVPVDSKAGSGGHFKSKEFIEESSSDSD